MRARRSTLLLVAALVSSLAATALGGACGKLKPAAGADGGTGTAGASGSAGSTGPITVTISGAAAPHPLNAALDASADFSMLKVAIVDPVALIGDPTTPPLGAATLDTSMTNCNTTVGCAWSLPGVDITNLDLGLVGTLEDLRAGDGGDAREWVKTGTGMGTKAFLEGVRGGPAPITDRRAFAVSRALEAKLGAFLGPLLSTTFNPGDLEARGFLIGHIVGPVVGNATPPGVAGATVSVPTAAAADFDVVYPNATFTDKGAATDTDGIFLMVPKTATSVVATWTVIPPASETHNWDPYIAGSNPGNAFIIIMAAND